MKEKLKYAYMDTAQRFAELSTAEKRKVGAVIVKDGMMFPGYNGTPSGWSNVCERIIRMPTGAGEWLDQDEIESTWRWKDQQGRYRMETLPEVLHAERNALDKITQSTISSRQASLFVTCTPCLECAKSIHGAGISEVYYVTDRTNTAGVDFLKKCGIHVEQLTSTEI